MGTILFIIYVNDFPLERTVMYANDKLLIISDITVEVSQSMTVAQSWFTRT